MKFAEQHEHQQSWAPAIWEHLVAAYLQAYTLKQSYKKFLSLVNVAINAADNHCFCSIKKLRTAVHSSASYIILLGDGRERVRQRQPDSFSHC